MNKIKVFFSAAALTLAGASSANAALIGGDIAFTSFNADEDGWSIVALADITANTTIYFTDNEWNGSAVGAGGAFNTGESYHQWNSGGSLISAGTVIRFSSTDSSTLLSSSYGTFSRVSVSGNTNYGLSNDNDTVYAYLGSGAASVTTFLTAASNAGFTTAQGTLTNTGLAVGTSAVSLTASTDYAGYTGDRSGLTAYALYAGEVNDSSNWYINVDGNGSTYVPDTTSFTVAPVPVPAAVWLLLSGVAGLFGVGRRRAA